jgi:hypothetical protein
VELGYKSNGPGPEIKKKREMQCYDYKIMSGASEREREGDGLISFCRGVEFATLGCGTQIALGKVGPPPRNHEVQSLVKDDKKAVRALR